MRASELNRMHRILEHTLHSSVECVRVGRSARFVNSAVWFYRIGDTLIDTGCPNQHRAVRAFVRERPQLRRALITHHHEGV